MGVVFRGAVGGLEVEERFVKLGRAAMLGCMLQDAMFRRDCTTFVTQDPCWHLVKGSKTFRPRLINTGFIQVIPPVILTRHVTFHTVEARAILPPFLPFRVSHRTCNAARYAKVLVIHDKFECVCSHCSGRTPTTSYPLPATTITSFAVIPWPFAARYKLPSPSIEPYTSRTPSI